jgi:hypothetical protein
MRPSPVGGGRLGREPGRSDNVADTAQMWSRVGDTSGMDTALGGDVPLLPAVTVAVDAMAPPER